MHFHYVDIGTSNFKTNLKYKKDTEHILLVEPLQFYLNDLPNGVGIIKSNCAVSDKDSVTKIFFVSPEDIEKYKLPGWVKGCNSINDYHPTVKNYLLKNNLSLDIIKSQEVEILSFETLVSKYGISSIGQLQIDTEGHDHVILRNVLDLIDKSKFKISKIIVEWEPSFGNTNELELLISKAISLGFKDLGFHKNNRIISKL